VAISWDNAIPCCHNLLEHTWVTNEFEKAAVIAPGWARGYAERVGLDFDCNDPLWRNLQAEWRIVLVTDPKK
jgi:hypothetical protein